MGYFLLRNLNMFPRAAQRWRQKDLWKRRARPSTGTKESLHPTSKGKVRASLMAFTFSIVAEMGSVGCVGSFRMKEKA